MATARQDYCFGIAPITAMGMCSTPKRSRIAWNHMELPLMPNNALQLTLTLPLAAP